MAEERGELRQHRLSLPATAEAIAELEPGNVVYLDGVVYTAREGVYQKIVVEREELPVADLAKVSNVNFHCSPAAASDDQGGYKIGGVTATASFRFSKYLADWLDLTGTKIIIGKGGMAARDYKEVLAPRGAIYLSTVGYGTGALLGRGVKAVESVHWLEELGIAQAMWFFRVENFGPFLVDSDTAGNSLFERHGELVNKGIEALYAGLKPPALRRYGETDDRRDELL